MGWKVAKVKGEKIMRKLLFLVLILIGAGSAGFAQIPERPVPARLVNDFAGVLGKNEQNALENSLQKFVRQTSTQIVVLTVPDLQGYDKADYAFQVGEKWGVGQKGKDNGIVVLLKPKTNDSKGQVFVATGYGLEAVLPDAIVNRDIVDYEMIPRFQQGDYYGGLAAGISVMMEITKGEYTAEQYQERVNAGGSAGIPFMVLFFILLFFLFGKNRRGRVYSPGSSLPFWLAMGMMSGGHRSSGSFGNFTSGGGSFGGFGGGSFGGGGAGGSW